MGWRAGEPTQIPCSVKLSRQGHSSTVHVAAAGRKFCTMRTPGTHSVLPGRFVCAAHLSLSEKDLRMVGICLQLHVCKNLEHGPQGSWVSTGSHTGGVPVSTASAIFLTCCKLKKSSQTEAPFMSAGHTETVEDMRQLLDSFEVRHETRGVRQISFPSLRLSACP